MTEPETHPVQGTKVRQGVQSGISTKVTLAAYEVYCHVCAPQPALIEGWCRGGFSPGELIAFLYARSFPKQEWRARVDEAFVGMVNL